VTIWEPETPVVVVHGAEQEVVPVDDQLRVAVWPEEMEEGAAERETMGGKAEDNFK
jgi:hypothetical protein